MSNRRLFDETLLTASFVYSTPVPLEHDKITLLVTYDADEAATGHVIIEVSSDSLDTATANSNWIQIGEISSSTGTLTFSPRELQLVAAGAGAVHANWHETVAGTKYRVGIKESSVASDFGNMTVHSYTSKA